METTGFMDEYMSIAGQLETALVHNEPSAALALVMQQQEFLLRAIKHMAPGTEEYTELQPHLLLIADRVEHQMLLLSQVISSIGFCVQQITPMSDTWCLRNRV